MTPPLAATFTWLALGLGTIPTAARLAEIQKLKAEIANLERVALKYRMELDWQRRIRNPCGTARADARRMIGLVSAEADARRERLKNLLAAW